MNVAVLDQHGNVSAINIMPSDYVPADNEVVVSGVAYVGGDLRDGHFYAPQPYPSWVRNNGEWAAPVPMPEGATWYSHRWDEETLSWIEVQPLT